MSPDEQERLTRVGPGTPMGDLLRRYWWPVAPIGSVTLPHRVRLLCEDLVLWRDAAGTWSLLDERCPHRGVSLAYGVCERDGLRCPYHGWKFAADGRCLETPAEPAGSNLRDHVRATAYPTQALGGLVWAYLGPTPVPLLPRFDVFAREGGLRDLGQATLPCSWLQIMENSVDPMHTEWLHGVALSAERSARGLPAPTHYLRKHERIGFDLFRHGIIKRRVIAGGSEADDDWAIGHPLIFPAALRVGEHGRHRMQWRVPIDDTHTWHLWYTHYTFGPEVTPPPQPTLPVYDVPWRDADGRHLVDFVDGQDIMAWVTPGPIADRTRERLASSDKGIVMLRRLYADEMAKVARGEDPLGVLRDPVDSGLIELPEERNKLRGGADFLRESLAMGHGRYSPIKDLVLALFAGA